MIATVCRILAARTRRHRLTSEVVLMSGGEKLLLAPSRIGGGGARVTLSGSLTLATARMMARWFVTLRSLVFVIELDVERVTRLDPGALREILRIVRNCALCDVAFRVAPGAGRRGERLRSLLTPSGLLAPYQSPKASSRESLTTAPAVTRRSGITRGSEVSVQATRS